uniref:Uncharacterized protein n=1 Tax=Rhizophagus irregularis (strain DAOM 181602 / DAOM 197198 / MUCL 43194) TaxID=747089 RepID=U9UIU9_RHIID
MAQEQKIIWTAKCLEEYNYNIGKDKNNWIKMAIKILNEEDIYLRPFRSQWANIDEMETFMQRKGKI